MSISISLNKNSFPLTAATLPTWRNYQGLTTTQKVAKIFVDTFKTLLWIIPVVPFTTAIIDFFSKKNVAPIDTSTAKETPKEKTHPLIKQAFKILDAFFISAGIGLAIHGTGILETIPNPFINKVLAPFPGEICTGMALAAFSIFASTIKID